MYQLEQKSERFLDSTPTEFWALYNWKFKPDSNLTIEEINEDYAKVKRAVAEKEARRGR